MNNEHGWMGGEEDHRHFLRYESMVGNREEEDGPPIVVQKKKTIIFKHGGLNIETETETTMGTITKIFSTVVELNVIAEQENLTKEKTTEAITTEETTTEETTRTESVVRVAVVGLPLLHPPKHAMKVIAFGPNVQGGLNFTGVKLLESIRMVLMI